MKDDKKDLMPTSSLPTTQRPGTEQRKWVLHRICLFALFAIGLSPFWDMGSSYVFPSRTDTEALSAAKCPAQPSSISLGDDWNPLTDKLYADLAAKRLSKAVQFNTVSEDSFIQLKANDTQLDKHYEFAEWMYNEYSKVFKGDALKHEVINYHGHLVTWEGKNKDLKPIVLMAHTDTVPAPENTWDQWTFPPWEGKVVSDATEETPGIWVWGRGSSDCKNQLMGILGAVERLVTAGYQPERTVLIASGFDEEIGGRKGAGTIAKVLEERYGKDSIAFLVDEGFDGVTEDYGVQVARFGMAEKGSVNVKIRVETPGGHSSVPPVNTGIGIMAQIINQLEDHPFKPTLDSSSPFLKSLTCLADHAPDFPKSLKKKVKNPKAWPKLGRELAKKDRRVNSFLATTQATDLIKGGVKVNALPEVVEATVNHRIAFTSSVEETINYIDKRLAPLAKSLNFTMSSFLNEDQKAKQRKSNHHIDLSADLAFALEPAPITKTDTPSFKLMAGTTKHVFGNNTLVAPSGMYANTDTRFFWNLTENLYRFTPSILSDFHVHTVDERMPLDGHLNTTRFFYKLIQNMEGFSTD